jgi:hypothetical protein
MLSGLDYWYSRGSFMPRDTIMKDKLNYLFNFLKNTFIWLGKKINHIIPATILKAFTISAVWPQP